LASSTEKISKVMMEKDLDLFFDDLEEDE